MRPSARLRAGGGQAEGHAPTRSYQSEQPYYSVCVLPVNRRLAGVALHLLLLHRGMLPIGTAAACSAPPEDCTTLHLTALDCTGCPLTGGPC